MRVPRLRLHARAGSPALPPVRIFLGTELAQHRAERVMLWSIAHYASPDRSYEVTLLRDAPGTPRKLGWATSFSNFRFLIPLLAGGHGKVIYNDKKYVGPLRGNRRFATGQPREEQGDEGDHGKQPSPGSRWNEIDHAGYGLRLVYDLGLGLH